MQYRYLTGRSPSCQMQWFCGSRAFVRFDRIETGLAAPPIEATTMNVLGTIPEAANRGLCISASLRCSRPVRSDDRFSPIAQTCLVKPFAKRRTTAFEFGFRARSQHVQRGTLNSRYQGRPLMRLLLGTVAAVGSLALAIAAFAQSTPTPATAVPVQSNPSPAEPVPLGKRFACQTVSQGLKGQEQRDQVQLCVAQAHLDCLKQAIDQKIVGPQRKDFVKSCVQ